ncbi:pyrimidodiazepine synthase [Agrilus planipennis]|uniref:Pyrimidodiazepine synthase n=1 Tax=Agrilus planipennis TaxID=224129 RepID=A0A1W4XPI1_AGRPL|nr:pyrimidodiazepine synthase [Agrilus planipennis]
MSLKHLAAGSKPVPTIEGKLRLYSMKFCPYAQRARLVLLAKNISHDIVNINLMNKPEWYFKIHPEGKVPALDTGSKVIVESLVIADFLDNEYPNIPLYPAEPAAQEKEKQLIKQIEPITAQFHKLMVDTSGNPAALLKELASLLDIFEQELDKRGTLFFFGSRPGMLDYMLWPWAERSAAVKIAHGNECSLEKDKFPKLRAWKSAMLDDPAVKATYNEPEKFWKLVQAKVKNEPLDYDSI